MSILGSVNTEFKKGTLRSEDGNGGKMLLKKWIRFLSIFITIIPIHILCQM